MAKKAKVTLQPDYRIGKVEDRMFGAFLEPIRGWVSGGVYNPMHPEADELGFRKDVLRAVREFGMPAIRLPGGNFVSGWDWKDSIGPKNQRKSHLDLAWRQYETNQFGHDEYLEWSRRAGTEPLYTLNLGTGDINDAIACVEYTNHSGGTYWSDLRKANGHADPYDVKVWYLGNEMDGPWQIRSWEKDPKGYGVLAHETSKAIKWIDPRIETVACVSCSPYLSTYPQWDIDVLEQCYDSVDYVSLHHYHAAPEGNIGALLNASSEFEAYIRTELAVCDYMKSRRRSAKTMMISFDEYAAMYKPAGKTLTGNAGIIPSDVFTANGKDRPVLRFDPGAKDDGVMAQRLQRNQMLSALGSASIIMTLLRHADRIKIGCMTGGAHMAIAFDNTHVWKSATYYPYYLMSKYGRGISILPVVDGPTFDVPGYKVDEFAQCPPHEGVQAIEAAAVADEETGEVRIFLINRDITEDVLVDLDVRGYEGYRLIEHVELYDPTLSAANTFESPDALLPKKNPDTRLDVGRIALQAKSLSWNMIRLEKKA